MDISENVNNVSFFPSNIGAHGRVHLSTALRSNTALVSYKGPGQDTMPPLPARVASRAEFVLSGNLSLLVMSGNFSLLENSGNLSLLEKSGNLSLLEIQGR